MNRVTFPAPLTHEEVKASLHKLLEPAELGAEERGRLRAHLQACDLCSEALAALIETEMDAERLPRGEVPPLRRPPVLFDDHGRVRGIDLPAVRQHGGDAARPLVDAHLAAFSRSAAVWRLTGGAAAAHAGGMGAFPMGSHGIEVRHLDSEWKEIPGAVTSVTPNEIEEGPRVTVGGEFRLALSSTDARWAGGRLICSVELVEGRAIRFESAVEAAGGRRWRAQLQGSGLPEQETTIPLEFVHLYLAPPAAESER